MKDKVYFKGVVKGLGVKNICFKVGKFKLIKLELRPQDLVYEVIEEFKARD